MIFETNTSVRNWSILYLYNHYNARMEAVFIQIYCWTLRYWKCNLKQVCMFTIASCRPMLPTVTPPEKNMHGSQDRTYKKSGDVYLKEKNHLVESLLTMERGFSDAALWVRNMSAEDNPDRVRALRRTKKQNKTWKSTKFDYPSSFFYFLSISTF